MDYLLDTVTLVRYLTNRGKIPRKVRKIFDEADQNVCQLLISTVSLMEILYLAEKNRIPITLEETVEKIQSSTIYEVVTLTPDIILAARSVEFYELHDRLILATAKYLDIPVISSDQEFKKVKNVKTIW